MNRLQFAIAESKNTIHGDWDPDLSLDPEIATVDITLIDGPLLASQDFINDYSEPIESSEHPGARRYRSLSDVLATELADELRQRMVRLLKGLCEDLDCGPSWVLWMKGHHSENQADGQYYSIDGYVDVPRGEESTSINGQMTIMEVKRDELEWYSDRFGKWDQIVGLATPEDAIDRVLRSLSLACPWPTSRKYSVGRMDLEFEPQSLAAVLECERSLFFEECDNGTRLRLASKAFSADRLREAVAARLRAFVP